MNENKSIEDDIQFLKDLQHKLINQETDYQASPRFWMIKDYRTVPANEDYDFSHIAYFHSDGDYTEFENVDDLKEYLNDHYSDDEYSGLKDLLENKNTSFEELWEYVGENMNDDENFREVPVKEESFLVPNTMFLTKESAKNHLKVNHYHYSKKAHTYAMTAWRSPQVERLMNILENFDWDLYNK